MVSVTGTLPGPWTAPVSAVCKASALAEATKGAANGMAAETPDILRNCRRDNPALEDDCLDLRFLLFFSSRISGESSTGGLPQIETPEF